MVFRIFPDHKPSFTKIHRSGWEHALNVLEASDVLNGDIVLDTYIDRTFHLRTVTKLPYSVPWVGCVHHTFDTTYSASNNMELLKNEVFLNSLDHCKGLFVFTQDQKQQWMVALAEVGYGGVPVDVLIHPTEMTPAMFSMSAFKKNKDKKLIQIGAWLRDPFAIYKIPPRLMIGSEPMKKAVLKGPYMETNVCPPNFMRWLEQSMQDFYGYRQFGYVTRSETGLFQQELRVSSGASASGKAPKPPGMDVACRDSTKNQFLSNLYHYIEDTLNQVEMIDTLDNEAYDALLTDNIVFLRLVDAAAVNTLLECVVRSTPVVVNRGLPGVEELLGRDYPLYYESIYDIPKLLNVTRVQAAHDHLRRLDKSLLMGEAFLKSIKDSSIYQNSV